MGYTYPPASLAALLPQAARAEHDCIALLVAHPTLAALLVTNEAPATPPAVLTPRIYRGRQPSNLGTRPYIVLQRTSVEFENGAGKMGGPALVMYAPIIQIHIVSSHYDESLDIEAMVTDIMNQRETATISAWQMIDRSFGEGPLEDGSGDPAFSVSLTWRCHQKQFP